MVGPDYLAPQRRSVGPLLTVIAAAAFLVTGFAAGFGSVGLSREADALATAPICTGSRLATDCRLRLGGTVVGGFDEGSGLTPERHVDIRASNGDLLHLTSAIIGAPPSTGSGALLEYWKGKLVRFATTAGTVRTDDHPARIARTSRLLAWHAFGSAGVLGIWFVSRFRRGRRLPGLLTVSEGNIGVSRWFIAGIVLIVAIVGLAGIAADGLSKRTLDAGIKDCGLVALALSLVVLSALGRKVSVTKDGLRYRRRFVTFPSIAKVTLEPGRLAFSGLRVVTLYPRNAGKPIAIDTRYFGWANRVLLLETVASRAPAAEFDGSAAALRHGEASGRQAPASSPDPWQSQNRGCATALVGVGSVLIVLGLVFESLGGPQIGGLWLYAVGAILVGVGIHRNVKVLRAAFGRPRGDLLLILETLAPIVAWAIDLAGEMSSNASTQLLFRFLSLLPFVAVWMLIWIPLGKVNEQLPTRLEAS